MGIKRDYYVDKLILKKQNGLIKKNKLEKSIRKQLEVL